MVEKEVHRVNEITRELTKEVKDMVEEENAQLKTFSIFHRASKLPVDPFKWGEKGGDISSSLGHILVFITSVKGDFSASSCYVRRVRH